MNIDTERQNTELIWQRFCQGRDPSQLQPFDEAYQRILALFQQAITPETMLRLAVLERGFLASLVTSTQDERLHRAALASKKSWLKLFKTALCKKPLTVPQALEFIGQNPSIDERMVLTLVKRCAKKYPKETSEHFNDFGLKADSYRYRAARQIAQNSGVSCSIRIKSFQLEAYHPRLVLHAARSTPLGTAMCLGNYTLSPQDLYKTASVIAKINGRALAENLGTTEIPEEKKRYRLALKAAKQDGEAVMANIEAFQLKDSHYIQVVRRAFAQNPKGCLRWSRKLVSLSEKERFELLREWISQDPVHALQRVKEAQIHTEEYLFELSQIAASINSYQMLHEVSQWDIQNEERRFILAQLCAQNEPRLTIVHIENFKFADSGKQNTILQLCSASL